MSKNDEESLTGLEVIELHRIETQWTHDLADEHEFRGGKMVVIVHLPETDRSADRNEVVSHERMFHLFLTAESRTDVLARCNPNDLSDQDLQAAVRRLLPE